VEGDLVADTGSPGSGVPVVRVPRRSGDRLVGHPLAAAASPATKMEGRPDGAEIGLDYLVKQ
jgi:hypothetical protein